MTPLIPYSRQCIDDDDIAAVVRALKSPMLTTGPEVELFEQELAAYLGAKHVIAVNSGTAALHLALLGHGIGPGDEVIVPTLTFVATANAVLMCGATPVFADLAAEREGWVSTLIPPMHPRLVTRKTKAIVGVDFAGDHAWSDSGYRHMKIDGGDGRWIPVIYDAAHSLGVKRTWGSTSTFSFHPVKTITTGEGGAIATGSDDVAAHCRLLRSHGRRNGEMVELGWNYRMSDIAAALGRSQLRKASAFVEARRALEREYGDRMETHFGNGHLTLTTIYLARSAWHLFPVLYANEVARDAARVYLAQCGWETQIHYRPVHLARYYRERFGYREGMFPVAEDIGRRTLSLPIWPGLSASHVELVAAQLTALFAQGGK